MFRPSVERTSSSESSNGEKSLPQRPMTETTGDSFAEKYFIIFKHSVVYLCPKAQANAHFRISSQRKLPYLLGRPVDKTDFHRDETRGWKGKIKGIVSHAGLALCHLFS